MQEEHSIHRLHRSLHKQRARDIRSYLLSIREDSDVRLACRDLSQQRLTLADASVRVTGLG